jgi:glutathione peroxidase
MVDDRVESNVRCGDAPRVQDAESQAVLTDQYADRARAAVQAVRRPKDGHARGSRSSRVKYEVTSPVADKVDVTGTHRHALYAEPVSTPDVEGHTGDVPWSFEKFLVALDGTVAARSLRL